MTSTILYKGEYRTEAVHLQSGTQIETDAPTDNNGKGERFSPTDLVATALGSCMISIMAMSAEPRGISLLGTTCEITKIMVKDPRRIGEIVVKIQIKGQDAYDEKERIILERAAMTCPVIESLHPDVKKSVEFVWP